MTRMVVIGLDCLPPRLVFDEWRDQLRRAIQHEGNGDL
jgi:hypothetical protein